MARTVLGPAPGGTRKYIPECWNNRDDRDPIVVTIKDPTEAEKRKLTLLQAQLDFSDGDVERGEDGAPNIRVTLESMARFQRMACLDHVVKVTGYNVRGVEIVDGESLAIHGETELLAELSLEISTALSLDEPAKNASSDLSDSKQAGTGRSIGTAGAASDGGWTSTATATGEATRGALSMSPGLASGSIDAQRLG